MIVLKSLRFFSPPDDGSGSAATVVELEGKAAGADIGPELAPPGEVYQRTMRELQGKPEPVGEPAAPAKKAKAEPKAKEPVKTDDTAKSEPVSALDAAFDAPPTEAKAEGEQAQTEETLPETLPTEPKERSEHWSRARAKIERLEKQISDVSAKASATPVEFQQRLDDLTKKNAELQKLNDEYKDSMVALNVEFEPEYRKKFVEGREQLVTKAASKLNAFGGKGELIVEAMKMPESRARTTAINEALADLDEGERFRVREFISQVERLDDEKSELQQDPQTAWEKLKATETNRKQQEAKEAENYKKRIYDDTLKAIPEKVLLLREVDPKLEGGTEHNANRQKIIDGAWRLLGSGVTPQELAEKAFKAEAYDYAQPLLVSARKEIRELNKRLADYEGAEPTFRGGKPPQKSDAEAKLEKTPGQIYQDTIRDLRGGADD